MSSALPTRLLLLLASTLAAVALCEGALRVAGYDPIGRIAAGSRFMVRASADPDLVYEFTPGTSGHVWGCDVAINSRGFRDREVPLAKDGATMRVAALGDSVTFGPGLEAEERWTDRLQARWEACDIDAEVLNFGVLGYDTAQEVAFFQRVGLEFAPDQVILCFCINDLETVSLDLETIATLRRFERGLLSWSRAAQWVTLALDRIRSAGTEVARRDRELLAAAATRIVRDPVLDERIAELQASLRRAGTPTEHGDRVFRRRLSLYTKRARLQRVRDAFEQLARLSREHDFGVTVFVSPTLHEGLDAEGWQLAYGIVQHLAESSGFRFVDVYPGLRAMRVRLKVKPNDNVHLNASAHEEMARALEEGTRDWFE